MHGQTLSLYSQAEIPPKKLCKIGKRAIAFNTNFLKDTSRNHSNFRARKHTKVVALDFLLNIDDIIALG